MRNYDFHELLSFDEFQRFATELVSIKENIKLRCNPIGQDGGIDFYSLDGNIFGQVKNTKNNFSSLKASLKKEVARVKKEKPNHYILVTATSCTKNKKTELVDMFEGYLKYEDILDKNELNTLLKEEKYHNLEIEYLKLLVPNTFVLSHFLEKIEYKKIYTQTEIELNKIRQEQKVFSPTETFKEALDKLQRDKTIIISGEPGVGKTILGRMLSAYIINSNPNIEFISVNTIDELYQIYNETQSQLYFFDDFWGDIKFNFQINSIEQKKLIKFIEYIGNSSNKWLIITTREYILNEGIENNKLFFNKYLNHKLQLELKDISKVSKFNILLSHLKTTNLSWEHLNIILKHWKTIVDNENYNPRLIETFLEKYEDSRQLDDIEFLKKFQNYLKKPYEYWEATLTKQSLEEIILLINIALNEYPPTIQELNKNFNEIIRNNPSVKRTDKSFQEIIKKMEDTFTVTKLYDDNLHIDFKNPSYREFILNYFSENIVTYIQYIYNDFLNIESCINLWRLLNKKIDLCKDYPELNKLDNLILTKMQYSKPQKYYFDLVFLVKLTNFNYESKIKQFIISKITNLLENLEDNLYMDIDTYNITFDLLSALDNRYDFSSYVYEILDLITFSSEDFYGIEKLADIKKLYPDKYQSFFKEYKSIIKSRIKECLLVDAYYYKQRKDVIGIDHLINYHIPEFYKKLNLTIPKKLIEKLETIAYEIENSIAAEKTNIKPPKNKETPAYRKKAEDLSIINQKIENLIGEDQYVSNLDESLKKYNISPKVKKKINQVEKSPLNLFYSLLNYKKTLQLVCEYLETNQVEQNFITFLEKFINFVVEKNNLTSLEVWNLYNICFLLLKNKKVIFTLEELKNIPGVENDFDILKILNSDFFIKRNKWYHPVHPIIQLYLATAGMKKLNFEFNVHMILNYIVSYNKEWYKIDYVDYDNVKLYKLLSLMFPKKWYKQIEILYFKDFLKNIDTKDDITIATSILKQFSFVLQYDKYGYTSMVYKNFMTYDLINLTFGIEILDLFTVDFTINDQMRDFVEQLIEKEEELDVNNYLRRKSFIKLLKESGSVDFLNDLYKEIIKLLEKEKSVAVS